MPIPHQLVLGIDAASVGSRKGWAVVAATWDGDQLGSASRPRFVERLAELQEAETPATFGLGEAGQAVGPVVAIGIDIPIGLATRGWRGADLAGRHALGGRASTLFPMAPRAAVEEPDYGRAKLLAEELTGKRISKQSHGLSRRVLELDGLLRAGDASRSDGPEWYEVHPELSFAAMAGEVVAERKKTWAGLERRRALLADVRLLPAVGIDDAAGLSADDVFDAASACWSAARALAGRSIRYHQCPAECTDDGHLSSETFDELLGRELVIHA